MLKTRAAKNENGLYNAVTGECHLGLVSPRARESPPPPPSVQLVSPQATHVWGRKERARERAPPYSLAPYPLFPCLMQEPGFLQPDGL